MHFFYLDESGDTGKKLDDAQQPVFVLGGLSVSDKKWNRTKDSLDECIADYFAQDVPSNFELHSAELLSPTGEGPFLGHAIEDRLNLTRRLLEIPRQLGHNAHYFAVVKDRMQMEACAYAAVFDIKTPYLLSFEYLVTYMNWHVKENLGSSARGMIVLDEKEEYHGGIEDIIHNRRYGVPATHKVKWIVEFSYPVDSKKNPMIQLSDLIALCIRRFLEIELGYKDETPDVVKRFYAECFNLVSARIKSKKLIARAGKHEKHLNSYIASVCGAPAAQWRKKYGLSAV